MGKRCRLQTHLLTAALLSSIILFALFSLSTLPSRAISSNFDIKTPTPSTNNLAVVLQPEKHAGRQVKTVTQSWNITSDFRAPDGVTKRVYLINGQFPGPLIEARSGDEIVVEVVNALAREAVTIHWHGLSLLGANDMDGVAGLTQAPIQPGESFKYRFKVGDEEAGTFWYHAHSEVQRADGLCGPLIVHSPESPVTEPYDDDLALMIGDWYHRSAKQVQNYYEDWKNFGNEPAPDSIVINGRGRFNCSMAVPARPLECSDAFMPDLRLGSGRNRLRIVNAGALTGFTISLPGYSMTVLSVDGENIVSNTTRAASVGVLYPGERVDILLERDTSAEYKNTRNLKFKNFALTPTQHFPITNPSTLSQPSPPPNAITLTPFYNLQTITGPKLQPNTFPPPDQITPILLYTKISILSEYDNMPKGFINRTSWSLPSTSKSPSPLISLPKAAWGNVFIPQIKKDQWVEITLHNLDDRGHPFHLHGYNFYILAASTSSPYSKTAYKNSHSNGAGKMELDLQLESPVMRDTIYIPRRGYVVLRFRATNEGLWLWHCHLLWHFAVGMGMALQVGGREEGFV